MKNRNLTISSSEYDDQIETLIKKRDAEIKEAAYHSAVHLAQNNLPALKGDKLLSYIGTIITAYDKLKAETMRRLQPDIHLPEAKIDQDLFKRKQATLQTEVMHLEHLNGTDKYTLGSTTPAITYARIRWTIILSLMIISGEVAFNAKSFVILGENLLLTLLFAVSITTGVLLFSHFAVMLYKMAKNTFQRRFVAIGSVALITAVFIGLSVFRTAYLAGHQIYIAPIYFVLINIFYAIVVGLLGFFFMPSWNEIKQSFAGIRIMKMIKKRTRAINALKTQSKQLHDDLAESTKRRVRSYDRAQQLVNEIDAMRNETIEFFKQTNIAHRPDKQIPDCYFTNKN